MRVLWVRGNDHVAFNRPNTWFVLGVRGSGKSSLLEHIGENYLNEGHSILDLFGCYDEETEVLTEDGWKRFPNLVDDDKVATLNPEGFLEYQRPYARQVYRYKGKMIRFGGSRGHYDLLVTPNHGMLIRNYWDGNLKQMKADEIVKYAQTHKSHHVPFRLLRTAKWKGQDIEYMDLPMPRYRRLPKKVQIDTFLTFLGWYLAEGSAYKNQDTYKIVLNTNPFSTSEQEEVTQIISEMGFNPINDRGRVLLYSERLVQMLKPLGHAKEKFIPKWVKQLPSHRLKFLLEAMMKGDGHGCVYSSASKRLADDFQEVAVKCGYGATLSVRPQRKVFFKKEKRTIQSSLEYMVIISRNKMKEPQISKKEISLQDYDGFVYCVTVPNHVIFVRRNGKTVWCGNSRDGEALAWLRSPHAKDKKILLVHGDNVDIESSFDTKNISKITLEDLSRYDITISASPLYSSPNDEFLHVNHLIDLVYKRLYWQRLIYMIVRESANLYYSRLRISESQLSAKAESVYLIREARHCGISLGLDTLKYTSVDLDVRTVVDFLIMKAQGVLGFPDDLQWLYGYFEPVMVRTMPTPYFILVSKSGALGLGEFKEIEWHKRERENIVKTVGLKIEYGEEIDYGKSRGAFKTVNDEEHSKIIDSYLNDKSYGIIAKELGRSNATIFSQVQAHNKAIDRQGYCMSCRRVKSPHDVTIVKRTL